MRGSGDRPTPGESIANQNPERMHLLSSEPTTDPASLLGVEEFVQLSLIKGFGVAAHSVGFSERTLRRRFAERGLGLRESAQAFRKKEIVAMLSAGAPLSAIRVPLGFASASGFSRFVRRHFGMAPSALRRRILISTFRSN